MCRSDHGQADQYEATRKKASDLAKCKCIAAAPERSTPQQGCGEHLNPYFDLRPFFAALTAVLYRLALFQARRAAGIPSRVRRRSGSVGVRRPRIVVA
jgi:hypothetical protein